MTAGRSPPGTRRAGRSSRGPRRIVRVQAAHASNMIPRSFRHPRRRRSVTATTARRLEALRPTGRLAYPNGVEPAPRKRCGLRMRAYDGVVRRRGVSAAQPPTSGWSPGTCWARSYSPIKPGREPHLRRTPRFVTPWLYGRTKSRRERRHRHAAFGFGPQDVARIRPGIVYVSLCAYGHEGP